MQGEVTQRMPWEVLVIYFQKAITEIGKPQERAVWNTLETKNLQKDWRKEALFLTLRRQLRWDLTSDNYLMAGIVDIL